MAQVRHQNTGILPLPPFLFAWGFGMGPIPPVFNKICSGYRLHYAQRSNCHALAQGSCIVTHQSHCIFGVDSKYLALGSEPMAFFSFFIRWIPSAAVYTSPVYRQPPPPPTNKNFTT
jgi:hypothetical protein